MYNCMVVYRYGFAYGESWNGLIGSSKFVGYNFDGAYISRLDVSMAFAGTGNNSMEA